MSDLYTGSTAWSEKYSPKTLSEIVGHDAIIKKFSEFAQVAEFPNLLLTGPSGVGKTVSAKNLVYELYDGEPEEKLLFVDSYASRIRIRDTIPRFIRSDNRGNIPQVLIIERGDLLLEKAQNELYSYMKQYPNKTRVIITARFSSQVIQSLQSLCAIFRFTPIVTSAFANHIQHIIKKEEMEITDSAIDYLHDVVDGDLRRGTNLLQAAAIGKVNHVDKSTIESISPTVPQQSITQMITEATNGDYDEAQNLLDSILSDGISAITIIDNMYEEIREADIPSQSRTKILNQIGETRFRLESGSDPTVQLSSILAEIVIMSQDDGS